MLALQGAFSLHARVLASLGVQTLEVRLPEQLDAVDRLVVPGGESTTMSMLAERFELLEPLRAFARSGRPVFGTCAGAILLGRGAGERPPRLGLLDAVLERNAYGRQVDSFTRELDVLGAPLDGTFIRAPRIVSVGPDVRVLARLGDDPVLVEAKGLLAATFHPELGRDPRVHERFLALEPAQMSMQMP